MDKAEEITRSHHTHTHTHTEVNRFGLMRLQHCLGEQVPLKCSHAVAGSAAPSHWGESEVRGSRVSQKRGSNPGHDTNHTHSLTHSSSASRSALYSKQPNANTVYRGKYSYEFFTRSFGHLLKPPFCGCFFFLFFCQTIVDEWRC